MNRLTEVAIKSLPAYKKLSSTVAKFFMDYYELWNQREGCTESNQAFAEKEKVGVKTIEARFKALREAKVLKTTVTKYPDPYFSNPSGFVTSRKNELDPLFKAQLNAKIEYIKEELSRRQSISGTYRKTGN